MQYHKSIETRVCKLTCSSSLYSRFHIQETRICWTKYFHKLCAFMDLYISNPK
uniref:Uncharacterized protein n=1 Tax=Anguilla anguilla TaxID=7936 RepID=A0A0E9XI88_ANGAN